MPLGQPKTDDRTGLSRELERVVDRVRHLSTDRLADPAPPWASRADGVRLTARLLADAAQGVEHAADLAAPAPRPLPALAERALPDVLAVTGQDVLRATAGIADSTQVWQYGRRSSVGAVVTEARDALVALRRAL